MKKTSKLKTCIIVDDDFPQIRLIKHYIQLRNDITCINSFVDPEKAYEYSKSSHIDIAFLDIQMDALNGIELAKKLPKSTIIIYITSSPNYAFDAYQVNAVDYLLKPATIENFNKAVDKAIMLLNAEMISKEDIINVQKKYLTITVDRKSHKLNVDDIIYIESKHEYFCIHTSKKKYLSFGALKTLIQQLPSEQFVQIHKSYIINIQYIKSFSTAEVELIDNTELSIGRMFKNCIDFFKKQTI